MIEFGTRRAHGPEAGTLIARAAYIGGCVGASNVEAGRRFGIPIFGTLAHSFIMAYDLEEESFRDFLRLFPENATLLIDTYDTLAATDNIIDSNLRPQAVRLDSGVSQGISIMVYLVFAVHPEAHSQKTTIAFTATGRVRERMDPRYCPEILATFNFRCSGEGCRLMWIRWSDCHDFNQSTQADNAHCSTDWRDC